ncbi:MFS transporter [Aspergillus brunneoviolaceus CBS 621.78]|uniref:MFS general substrate transporter n=1 Tax=Aspergillus brunneoviolaceus CBS 621.78 TaxID=1450534 RepID=A0ACD1G3H0_9EURO|nr:MFS general substrate transporter [Aspergillus brunneoviolaceus CBS 621.78]RAH43812.1 MFS general substrate transporter [Aspergillus brunneoviolaceus CBS 621.78]
MASTTVSHSQLDCVPRQRRSVLFNLRSSVSFITFVASYAVFTDSFLYGLIVPVVPTALNDRLGVSRNDEQTWTSILIALYGAAQFSVAPLSGYVSDRIQSRWWPMVAGVLTLGAGTALLCAGNRIGFWIAGRLLQGAAAAIVWTVACALLVDTVAEEQLGHAMGYMSMGMTIGNLIGPLIGGAVYEHAGYYSVFIVAFVLISLDLGLRLLIIERTHAPEPVRGGSGRGPSLADPAREPAEQPEDESEPAAPPALQSHTGLQGLWRLFSSPRILVVLWTCLVISIVISAFDSALPLFVQDAYAWAQTAQGLIFIPFLVPSLLGPLVGWINDRVPSKHRRLLAGGALLLSVPPAVLLRLVSDNDLAHKVLLCVLLLLLGVCMSLLFPLVLAENSYAAAEKEQEAPSTFGTQGAMGLAYGLANSAYAAGSIAGPLLAGYIRQGAGWATMTGVLGLLTGVSTLPVLFWFGGVVPCRKIVSW